MPASLTLRQPSSLGILAVRYGFEAELRSYILEENITDVLFPNTEGGVMDPKNYLNRMLKAGYSGGDRCAYANGNDQER